MATQPQPRDQLRTQAAKVAESVTSTAGEATDSMKYTLREQADTRLDGFAEQVNTVSDALRETAQSLRSKQKPMLATQAERLATRTENVSRHLRENSAEGLLREAEDYTRTRPGLVLGVAALAGFAAARLLKVGGAHAASTTQQSDAVTPMPARPVGQARTHTPVGTSAPRTT
jgi:ElaB/YqjD/DUF883 family membrane-anchored ribosome-binding protein